jgi:galactosamine-6-phosphate isomerase
MLKPQRFADHEAVSRFAADWLIERVRRQPNALLCLATGSTPTRTYELLARHGAAEPNLFASVRVLNLDEWGGLPDGDPGSCDRQLRATFVDPLGLTARYSTFASNSADPTAEAARIADWLERHGPIDVSLLGLGINGHIGFNEPAEFLQPHAHVAQLSEASLAHAMIRSGGARPTYGLTLGMADLLQSRSILLLVTGATKRQPLDQLLRGQITTTFPASLLHTHSDARLLCDKEAVEKGDGSH